MFRKNKDDEKPICPLMRGSCVKHKCSWYTHVIGKDQNGKDVDHYDCAVRWIPILLIENTGEQNATQASIQSLRNENSGVGQQIAAALMQVASSKSTPLAEVPENNVQQISNNSQPQIESDS